MIVEPVHIRLQWIKRVALCLILGLLPCPSAPELSHSCPQKDLVQLVKLSCIPAGKNSQSIFLVKTDLNFLIPTCRLNWSFGVLSCMCKLLHSSEISDTHTGTWVCQIPVCSFCLRRLFKQNTRQFCWTKVWFNGLAEMFLQRRVQLSYSGLFVIVFRVFFLPFGA